jgi:hypothetical protein
MIEYRLSQRFIVSVTFNNSLMYSFLNQLICFCMINICYSVRAIISSIVLIFNYCLMSVPFELKEFKYKQIVFRKAKISMKVSEQCW